MVKDANGEPLTAEQCIDVAQKIEAEMVSRPEHWHRAMKATARQWRQIAARLLVERRAQAQRSASRGG